MNTLNPLAMHVEPAVHEDAGTAAEQHAQSNAMTSAEARVTPEQAQQWFLDHGVTVTEWAMARGFNPALVYGILRGRRKCLRGQSHKIAVALGLKPNPAS